MHSSRVGVSTSAWTSSTEGSTCSIIGSPKAAVLPEPVWACPMTSRPSSNEGIVGARGLAERIGRADHDAQLTAARQLEELRQRLVDHRGSVERPEQPE